MNMRTAIAFGVSIIMLQQCYVYGEDSGEKDNIKVECARRLYKAIKEDKGEEIGNIIKECSEKNVGDMKAQLQQVHRYAETVALDFDTKLREKIDQAIKYKDQVQKKHGTAFTNFLKNVSKIFSGSTSK